MTSGRTLIEAPLSYLVQPDVITGSLSNKIAAERYIIIPYSLKQGLLSDRSRLSREDKLECICICVSRQIPRSSSKDPNPVDHLIVAGLRPNTWEEWWSTKSMFAHISPPFKSRAWRVYLQRAGARHASSFNNLMIPRTLSLIVFIKRLLVKVFN